MLPASLLEHLANPLVPGMAGPLLCWLADHETSSYQKARWALQPKDWLRLRLTDEVATDKSDASATLVLSSLQLSASDRIGDAWRHLNCSTYDDKKYTSLYHFRGWRENVTTSLKSCRYSTMSPKDGSWCFMRFHSLLSRVPITR